MKTKKVCFFVCFLLLLSLVSPMALADELDTPVGDPIDPSPYTYISTIFMNFEISSTGLTDDYCRVYIPDSSCSCWIDMYLQRWNSSSNDWETVKSWSKYGSSTIALEKEWYVASGYTYRLKCIVSVYDSDGLLGEAVPVYSNHYYY